MTLWKRQRLLLIDWPELSALLDRLLRQVVESNYRPTGIVGVCRGGLVPATFFSNVLEIPAFFVVSVTRNLSNDRYCERGEPCYAWMAPDKPLDGHRLLVAEDITGDGRTLSMTVEKLRERGPDEIRTAVIAKNCNSQFSPDFQAITVDDWVVFPWEARKKAHDPQIERLRIDG